MQIIENTTEFHIKEKTAITIGKFDGVHKGHQRLLQEILEQKKKGLKTVVLTFDPSPADFFSSKHCLELTTKQEKIEIFEKLGIDILVIFPFSEETAHMEPEDFVSEILVQKLQGAYIAAGEDLSFGNRGLGDYKLIQKMSKIYNYEVSIINKVCYDNREISSTFVREEVQKGHMELVEELLGEPYLFTGVVEHGNRIGRTLGMPTVNLIPPEEKLLPPFGVYYSKTIVDGTVYQSITNIGYKPTVTQEKIAGVETYLYDFNKDVYGEQITVKLIAFKRPERKFSSLDALKKQLDIDIMNGKMFKFDKR